MKNAAAFVVVFFLIAGSSSAQTPEFILAWGGYGVGPSLFDRPVAVAVNSAGEIYVGDSRQGYVQRFTSTGQFLGSCANGPSTYCPIAMALAVDPRTDRVIASDPTSLAIQVYSRDLTPVTWWNGSGSGGVGVAYGVAVGPTGDLFIAGGAGHTVSRWTQEGTLIQRWPDPGPGTSRLQSAWGIGIDPAGLVYVADYAAHRVIKFTQAGNYVWGVSGSGAGEFGPTTNVCADAAGNILIADPYNNRVQVFTPNGAFLSAWGIVGQGPGEFQEPYGLTAWDGYVFVADAGNSRIQKFRGVFPTPAKLTSWGSLKTRYR